jgi:hypothetical protein
VEGSRVTYSGAKTQGNYWEDFSGKAASCDVVNTVFKIYRMAWKSSRKLVKYEYVLK